MEHGISQNSIRGEGWSGRNTPPAEGSVTRWFRFVPIFSAVLTLAFICAGLWFFWQSQNASARTRPTTQAAPASLTITPARQHLGKIRQFETQAFTFTVTNTGKKAVEITGIEKSCGCTEVQAAQTTLRPGESTKLTGALAAQDRLGEFGSTIQVQLSDGSVVQAQVGGKAVNVLQGPTHLDLGSSYIDEKPATQTFTFKRGEDDLPWDFLKLRSEGLKAESIRHGNTWQVSITPPRTEEIAVHRRDLVLECWKERVSEPAATLPVTALWKTKSRYIEITPMAAYFGVMKPGEEKTVRLKVKNLTGEPIRLEKVEFPKGMNATATLVSDAGNPNQLYLKIQTRGLPPDGGGESGVMRAVMRTGDSVSQTSCIKFAGKK